ncbi:MAG: GNAT family N-acetyltransferase [Microthrixaceae bacterium]
MEDLPTIGATFGAAFEDDPVARWVLGDRRLNDARVGVLYEALAEGHIDDGLSSITSDGRCAAIWAAPGRYRVPTRRFLRHLPPMLRALGPGGLRRVISMAEVEKLHPREPHYYLAILGTHPDRQGRGYGLAAMAPILERADAEGVGCYLESSKEQNVPWYRRAGFEVTATHDLGKSSGPRLWLMWRDPRPPG